jgi:hypothetical protein
MAKTAIFVEDRYGIMYIDSKDPDKLREIREADSKTARGNEVAA